jgi:hypothetical protein
MLDPQSVVVYRSQMEKVQDEFWMAHPEIAMFFFGLVLVVFASFFLKFAWEWFSMNRLFKRRWKGDRYT